MIESIAITNNSYKEPVVIELANPERTGLIIEAIDGLGPVAAEISMISNSRRPGGTFGSSRVPSRNIVINLRYFDNNEDVESLRSKTYSLFPIEQEIQLIINTDKQSYYTYGFVESLEPNIFSKIEGCTISMICEDPYLHKYDPYVSPEDFDFSTTKGGIKPMLSFPLSGEWHKDDIIFSEVLSVNGVFIDYPIAAARSGIRATVKLTGVNGSTHFTIENETTGDKITIESRYLEPMLPQPAFGPDDVIVIDTRVGHKKMTATLKKDGKVHNLITGKTKDSTWLCVEPGGNNFRIYDAKTKHDLSCEVTIEYNINYRGI